MSAGATMRAMVLEWARAPLVPRELATPEPAAGEVAIDVGACGVCRTDLHIKDGELAEPKLPLVPGHEIVGRVRALGAGVTGLAVGDRVGVPWLGHSCGDCPYCRRGMENLCDFPLFTGYTRDGGYAEACVADAAYAFALPEGPGETELAAWLCAGLIGQRALTMAGDAERLGLYGFGAAAHLIAQMPRHQGRRLYAFTRPGDTPAQGFARAMGVDWTGGSDETPPEELDAGIHMSDIPSFRYADLWGERVIRSVANLTRADGETFLAAAARAGVEEHRRDLRAGGGQHRARSAPVRNAQRGRGADSVSAPARHRSEGKRGVGV